MTSEPEKLPRERMETLLAIMARLRDPERGCPWDVRQTFETIAPYTIEEAYEVAQAIANGDMDNLREELGDLLLQVVFHARMAEEAGIFDFAGVVRAVNDKMIFRHPHVFGDEKARGRVEEDFWDKAKAAEKAASGKPGSGAAADDVPLALPALTRALKLQKKAARAGHDWPDARGVLDKVNEEAEELRQAMRKKSREAVEEELGDLLFTLVNLARHLKLDPEGALRRANDKFSARLRAMEEMAARTGRSLAALDDEEREALWTRAKRRRKEP